MENESSRFMEIEPWLLHATSNLFRMLILGSKSLHLLPFISAESLTSLMLINWRLEFCSTFLNISRWHENFLEMYWRIPTHLWCGFISCRAQSFLNLWFYEQTDILLLNLKRFCCLCNVPQNVVDTWKLS